MLRQFLFNCRGLRPATVPLLRRARLLPVLLGSAVLLCSCVGMGAGEKPELSVPGVSFNISGQGSQPEQVGTGVQLLVLFTVLSVAPAVLLLMTAFTRIVIVLSLARTALGTQQLPPNQVVTGLGMLLTFFVMAPVFNDINENALQPYLAGRLAQPAAITRGLEPLRGFMFKQTRPADIALFMQLAKTTQPSTLEDIPLSSLLPAFVVSELKTAFQMGFLIFIPFLVIDLVVTSTLLSLGMMFLPPMLVSLPLKLLLFVMADGWNLLVESLVKSF
jgi:flagellar biosynthetic protein FliP